jgi:hypothetical protein
MNWNKGLLEMLHKLSLGIYIIIVTSVACAVVGPSVTTSSTDVSFQNMVLRNSFEFSAADIT